MLLEPEERTETIDEVAVHLASRDETENDKVENSVVIAGGRQSHLAVAGRRPRAREQWATANASPLRCARPFVQAGGGRRPTAVSVAGSSG